MNEFGEDEYLYDWFFHLAYTEVPPERWRHDKLFDNDNGSAPIRFELYWCPVNDLPRLAEPDAEKLPELIESMEQDSNPRRDEA